MPRPKITLDQGRLTVRAAAWSLAQLRADRPVLRFADASGDAWADLLPIACADTAEGPDEWYLVGEPLVQEDDGRPGDDPGVIVSWEATSARWSSCSLVLRATHARLALRLEVTGTGRLTEVRLLGGRASAWPAIGTGRFWSGRRFDVIVSGGPDDPTRMSQPAAEAAAVGIVAGSQPGRGRWFFTPGPLGFAASRRGAAPWLAIGLAVEDAAEAGFTQVAYEADDNGWDVRLDYEGHTRVDGHWTSPWLELVPGMPHAYGALAAPGASTPTARPTPGAVVPSATPEWWLEPMVCGWGAQVAEAVELGVLAPSLATQDRYDRWLGRLEAHGVVPGTIVIDDQWQRTYGRNEPDEARWPDIASWIEARHRRGQRVLLWWKAWDPDGLPEAWTIRDRAGHQIAADPTNPAYADALDSDIGRLLRPRAEGGLGADGLKIDFTGAAPSGVGLRTYAEGDATGGSGPWGIALLHLLLTIVARAARAERPDALLITHTPNRLFADVLSMVRLNDALRLDDPVPLVPVIDQLRHRAAIVSAVLPDVPIDTDDWAMPSLAEWRSWQRVKPHEGVPALYHVDGIGTTGERLTRDDLGLVAREWAAYRTRMGLPVRRTA